MPAIQGYDSVWPDHPEWLDRYDFAIAAPPADTWYQSVHDCGASGVRYACARRRRTSWLPLPLSCGYDTERVFFTHFLWRQAGSGHDGQDGKLHCITRKDLVGAFGALVKNCEDVFHLHADLREALIDLGRAAPGHPLLARASAQLEEAARIAVPISNATEYYAKYLSFFSDLESAKSTPRHWLVSTEPSRSDSISDMDYFSGAWRSNDHAPDPLIHDGTIDTHAFTAAARWVEHERKTMCPATDATIASARTAVDTLRSEMYAVMRRPVPPPWDRSKRRTSVVELWEDQVTRHERRMSADSVVSSAVSSPSSPYARSLASP